MFWTSLIGLFWEFMVPMQISKGIIYGRSYQGFPVGGKFLGALGETLMLLAS
jgi:hypothetical protein